MNLLALIPARVYEYALIVLACALIGWGFIAHERELGAARVEAVRQAEHAAAAAVAASAVASAAAESQRREARIQEIVHATQQAASAVAADASTAARERDALRVQLRTVVAAGRGGMPDNPAPAASGPAAGPDAAVLADLLGRAVDRDLELARIADERGVAGTACERSYDALSR